MDECGYGVCSTYKVKVQVRVKSSDTSWRWSDLLMLVQPNAGPSESSAARVCKSAQVMPVSVKSVRASKST